MVNGKQKKIPKKNGNGGNGKRRGGPKQQPRMPGNKLSRSVANGNGYSTANYRPVINKTVTLSGRDYLGKVAVAPQSGAGKIIYEFPISPSEYPGTRLTQLSDLWEFFRFSKFHVQWVPAVPDTLACQFVLYVDLDPTDDPSVILDEDALIRQAVAQTGSQQWNFHMAKTIPMAMRADRQMYFTGSSKQNIRFSQQGKGYLIQVTNPVNFNGENIVSTLEAGSLFIDWTVNFGTAQINPNATIRATGQGGGFLPSASFGAEIEGGDSLVRVTGLPPGEKYLVSYGIEWTTVESAGSLRGYAGDTPAAPQFTQIVGGTGGNVRSDVGSTGAVVPGLAVMTVEPDGKMPFWLIELTNVVRTTEFYINLYALRPEGLVLPQGTIATEVKPIPSPTKVLDEAIAYVQSVGHHQPEPNFGEGTDRAGDGW